MEGIGPRGALSAFWFVIAAALAATPLSAEPSAVGIFDGQSDVGSVVPHGTGTYDAASDSYTITASGENLWYRKDAFHFMWKKMSGDVSLTADITFPPTAYDHPPNPHRKALFDDPPDAGRGWHLCRCGGAWLGLTALQYRREKGANTQDIELNIAAPKTFRLVKRGDSNHDAAVSTHGEPLHRVGATIKLHLDGPFYVGLGLASHDVTTTDRVVFSHVKLEAPEPEPPATVLVSTLQVIQTEDQFRRAEVIVNRPGLFESPNWAADGKSLLINENGKFWKIPLLDPHAGGTPEPFDIGAATGCWGEHGYSPDGKWLAISCSTPGHKGPDVYVVPASGGAERQVTHQPVSFFRGWSPDGKTIAFVSIAGDHRDVYTIPAAGGEAVRLTDTGQNDGAEFTPDGQFIYFNSDASGVDADLAHASRRHGQGAGHA